MRPHPRENGAREPAQGRGRGDMWDTHNTQKDPNKLLVYLGGRHTKHTETKRGDMGTPGAISGHPHPAPHREASPPAVQTLEEPVQTSDAGRGVNGEGPARAAGAGQPDPWRRVQPPAQVGGCLSVGTTPDPSDRDHAMHNRQTRIQPPAMPRKFPRKVEPQTPAFPMLSETRPISDTRNSGKSTKRIGARPP